MMCLKLRYCKYQSSIIAIFFIAGLWILSGCNGDNSTGPDASQVAKVEISPDEAALETGDQIDFSVFALTESGDTVHTDEIDIEWQWWSSDPDVFDVEPGGLATGYSSGEAFCVVEATVTVSQAVAKELDIRYASLGFNGNRKANTERKNMKLIREGSERMENVNGAFEKNRFRFVGRDSAIVFVF